MNESETRAEHVDPALKAAGWGVVEGSSVRREFRITEGRLQGGGARAKPEIADYVLVYRNTKLAVVEAKAWDKPHTEGVAQAKGYAAKLAIRHTYSTNGRAIYGIDMSTGAEGDVAQYPTPDELWAQTFAVPNKWRDRFAAVPFPNKSGAWDIRFYQEIAVNRVLEKVASGEPRILLTLATGTGKTSIAFQIAWKLFQSRWNLKDAKSDAEPTRRPRILFLADRNNLADQAYNDFTWFTAFADDALVRIAPADIRKKGRVPKNGSVFFTIFQTFMSGADREADAGLRQAQPERGLAQPDRGFYFGDYPPDFFDLIVIDECHRGGANNEGTWRGILEYFAPAVQLGLTATPRRKDNADTYAYFGEPVYVYSLKDGVNDGFLTPFKVVQIATTLDEYVYTADDTLVEGEIEAGKRYVEADFNRVIEIREREAYRVRKLMDMIDQREKSIVFCATQIHALAVRDLINQMKTSTDPGYCQRVTAEDGALGNQHLRDFQDTEKTIPTVLTTSQKLSTGVDARNVRNIVLLRPVNSMIEFKQIIGRGTRLYEGKDYFTIYDFVRAHQLFSDPEWDGEPVEPEVRKPRTPGDPPAANEPPADYVAPVRAARIKVTLADGKERSIQSMVATSFWGPDGKPLSAAQFMETLFGTLPDFFSDEAELRTIWSDPDTRKALLSGLSEKGFGAAAMAEMQKLNAPITRQERAMRAHDASAREFGERQQAFIDFVLGQYVTQGVGELDSEKLSPLLKLRYKNAMADALKDLGGAEEIRQVFVGFQRHLY